jgi:hypothetical protein
MDLEGLAINESMVKSINKDPFFDSDSEDDILDENGNLKELIQDETNDFNDIHDPTKYKSNLIFLELFSKDNTLRPL